MTQEGKQPMTTKGHAPICEDYVSLELAKLLKEKGFDEATNRYYNAQYDQIRTVSDTFLGHWNNEEFMKSVLMDGAIAIPTLQMAMKWLREVHNRYVEICMDKAHNFKDIVFRPAIYDKELDCLWESDNFSTYEEACEASIKYCLENLI